jgi:hypothetical protein
MEGCNSDQVDVCVQGNYQTILLYELRVLLY